MKPTPMTCCCVPYICTLFIENFNSCCHRPRTAVSQKQLDSSETRITSAGCQETLYAPRYTTFNLAPTVTRHVLEESMKV